MPSDHPSHVEVLTPAQSAKADLAATAQLVNETLETIRSHEGAMLEATLEHRLLIGLEIAKAQAVFGLSKAEAGAIGGSMPRRGMLSVANPNPLGFSNWIKTEIPELKRTTAQKYAIAFLGTGLSVEDATPQSIKEVVKKLRHRHGKENKPMPKLEDFYKAGKPKPSSEPLNIEAPKDSLQLRLEDARESVQIWKDQWNTFVSRGQLDDLDRKGREDLKEFLATCRDQLNQRLR